MENEFVVPARPWTDADVKFLVANADILPEEVKSELGLTPAVPNNDFKADFDAAKEADETAETIVVTQEILDENPVLAEAGVQVGDVGVATDEVPEGAMIEETPTLPTDTEGEVVNNDATDNA